MLSKYIANKEAFLDSLALKLTLTYLTKPLVLDTLPAQYSNLKFLVLNHCQLVSLEGIQQFPDLQSLSIKHNNIESVSELHRVKNKQKIRSLNFQGNSIQYCTAALFTKLKEVFVNLEELNGKDYSLMIRQKKAEKHGMKTILRKARKLQKQLTHLTDKEKMRPRQFNRDQKTTVQPIKEEMYSDSSFKQTRPTKRRVYSPSCQHHEGKELSEDSEVERSYEEEFITATQKKKNDSYSEESVLKENKNWNNINHDLSLGGISNIPMTKSVRASMAEKPKKKGLQIVTLDESLQGVHHNLAQPTATFAMQRQKEETNNFVFKNKSKRYQTDQIPLLQCQSKYELQRPTKRRTSESDEEFQWEDSQCVEDNLIGESILDNRERITVMVDKWYEMQLESKVFLILKHLPRKGNLPMKLPFE